MPRAESPLVTRGVELIRQRLERGEPPQQQQTAELLGISRVALIRACQRAGLELPRGQPRKHPATQAPPPP